VSVRRQREQHTVGCAAVEPSDTELELELEPDDEVLLRVEVLEVTLALCNGWTGGRECAALVCS